MSSAASVRLNNLELGWLTDVGRKREHNEDGYYVAPADERGVDGRGLLVAVADGIGGHAAGERASAIALEAVADLHTLPAEAVAASSCSHEWSNRRSAANTSGPSGTRHPDCAARFRNGNARCWARWSRG